MTIFKDKIVWITGASSGYGAALARAFSAAGAKVILSGRRIDKLQELAAELPQSSVVPLDLLCPESFADKTAEAIQAFGEIDLLVHAGGVAQNSPALTTQSAVARKIMQVDYFSYTELTQCVLPHFIERQSGHIVVVSGLLATLTLPGRSSYAAAKAALAGYFGCLRMELLPHHINVTLLIPGAMQTQLASQALQADGTPLNRQLPLSGCPVEEAAEQSLQAIAAKQYEAYIGLQDENFMLWRLTQCDPNLGIKLMGRKLQAAFAAQATKPS